MTRAVVSSSLAPRVSPWRCAALVLAATLLWFTAPSAWSQATSGTLTGQVTDPTGAVIPNATVTINDTQHGSSVTTTTNAEGLFTRTQLANSTYNVSVSATGFQPTQQNNVIVDVDRETKINVTMQIGGAQQTVEVVADQAPVLVTDRAEISTTVTSRELTDIPTISQNVTQLELLAPGTVRNTYDIAGTENPQGGQANNTNGLLFGFTNRQIDGADDMDAVLGIQVVNPPPDSLDQMKVTTSNYDAEFGRSGGSFVSYTTKSGSNDLHGDLFEVLRNNFFNARIPIPKAFASSPCASTSLEVRSAGPSSLISYFSSELTRDNENVSGAASRNLYRPLPNGAVISRR